MSDLLRISYYLLIVSERASQELTSFGQHVENIICRGMSLRCLVLRHDIRTVLVLCGDGVLDDLEWPGIAAES